jgi:hypothetical protein
MLLGGGKLEVKAMRDATVIRVEPTQQRTPDTIIVLTRRLTAQRAILRSGESQMIRKFDFDAASALRSDAFRQRVLR